MGDFGISTTGNYYENNPDGLIGRFFDGSFWDRINWVIKPKQTDTIKIKLLDSNDKELE